MNQEDVKVAFYLKRNVSGKPRAEANSFALCRGEKRCTNVNETNTEGRCPVMGRLTIGRLECVFSTKMLAPLSLWMFGRAKGKSTEGVEINRRLDEIRASAISIYREQSAIRDRVTAEEVKCLLLGMAFGQETLFGYFRSYIEHFEKRVGVNRTANQHAPIVVPANTSNGSCRSGFGCRIFLSRLWIGRSSTSSTCTCVRSEKRLRTR